MKRSFAICALFLCLLLCAALFTSCGKDKATTETEHEHVWGEGETVALTACEGEVRYVCTVCGESRQPRLGRGDAERHDADGVA